MSEADIPTREPPLDWTMRVGLLENARINSEWSARMAEAQGSGTLPAVVAQLRARARAANLRAIAVLTALLLSVLVGLGAYVAWPLVRSWVDGNRAALEQSIAVVDADAAAQSERREDLRRRLVEFLSPAGIAMESMATSDLRGHVDLGSNGTLIYGYGGTVLHIGADNHHPKLIETGTTSALTGDLDLGINGRLIYGREGTVLHFDADGGFRGQLQTGTERNLLGDIDLGANGRLIYGEGGIVLRIEADGSLRGALATGSTSGLLGHIGLGDNGWLIYGTSGTVLHIGPAGDFRGKPETGTPNGLRGHVDLGANGRLIYGVRGTVLHIGADGSFRSKLETETDSDLLGDVDLGTNGRLIYGDRGAVLHIDTDGRFRGRLPTATASDLHGHIDLGDHGLLIYGTLGTVLQIDAEGNFRGKLEVGTTSTLGDSIDIGEKGHLILGSHGTVLRLGVDGRFQKRLSLGTTSIRAGDLLIAGAFSFGDHVALASQGWLIFGLSGVISHIDANGEFLKRLETGTGNNLRGSIDLGGNEFLMYGQGGTVIHISGELAKRARSALPPEVTDPTTGRTSVPTELARDLALLRFIESNIDTQSNSLAGDIWVELTEIVALRRIIDAQREKFESDLRDLPTGAYFLREQRQTFRDFMADCRGGSAVAEVASPVDGLLTDPDAVTVACTAAWQARVNAEAGNWWQTLAAQIPPGILLLFLLATLGGLYRYNLRLAGFHASRADLLELLRLRPDLFEGADKDGQALRLVQIADALAADKVEFGKEKAPSEQAVEMFNAVMARVQK